LPALFGPITPKISPGSIANETSVTLKPPSRLRSGLG
jgi:hypothetical protein